MEAIITAESLARAFGRAGVPVSRTAMDRVRHRNKFAVFSESEAAKPVAGVETRTLKELLFAR